MKVAICDDDKKICDIIEDILDDYSRKNKVFIDIFQFYTVESLVQSIEDNNTFNLIFQDIEFPNMTGIDFGEFLRINVEDFLTDIVFITGSNEYDRKLFSFQPLYFVSKPFKREEIIKALELSFKKMEKTDTHFIYKKGAATIRIPANEIVYFQSMNREVIIHTCNGSDSFYSSLNEIENSLIVDNFIRVHKSFIVNSNFFLKIRRDLLTLKNGIEISVSRKYKENVMKYLERLD